METDIVSSTESRIAHGDYRTDLLEDRLQRLIVSTAERCGGEPLLDTGDGGTCLFPSVTAALEAAAALHRDGRELSIGEGTESSFRIGITAGELYPMGDADPGAGPAMPRLRGFPLLEVTRICAKAEPGTTLAAAKALALVRDNPWHVGPEVIVEGKGIVDPLPAHVITAERRVQRLPAELVAEAKIPLVGRSESIDDLVNFVGEMGDAPGSRLIAVVGEAGIGKTRLFAELAERAGVGIGYGRFDPDGAPFHPVLGAAEQLLASGGDHPPVPRGPVDEVETKAVDQLGYFQQVGDALARIESGAILILDDFHWADASTVDLVAFLVEQYQLPRTIVIGCRPGYDDRIERVTKGAARAARIELDPLPDRSCRALVRSVLPPAVGGPEVVDRLATHCAGSPLVAMVLAHGHASGLTPMAWQPADGGHADPMAAIVTTRMAGADERTTAVLECAAVTGELDVGLIAATLDRSVDDVTAVLDGEGQRRGLLRLGSGDRCRFVHDLVADAVAASVGPHDRAALRLAMAEAIAASSRPSAARVARHLLAAAELVPPGQLVSACLDAAADAVADLAYAVAAEWYAIAADHASDAAAELRIRVDHARYAVIAGQPGSRRRALDGARAALAVDLPRVAADALLATDRGLFGMLGQTDEAFVELAEQTLERVPPDTRESAHLRALLGAELIFSRRPGVAGRRLALSDTAVAEAETVGDDVLRCQVLALRGITLRGMDGIGDRRRMCEQLHEIAHGRDDPWLHLLAATELGAAALEDCDVPLADRCVYRAIEAAERLRQPRAAWLARQMETALLIQHGRLDAAETARLDARASGTLAGFAIEAWVTSVEQRLEILRWQGGLAAGVEQLQDWAGVAGRDLALSGLKYLALVGPTVELAKKVAELDIDQLLEDGPEILHGPILVNLGQAAMIVEDRDQIDETYERLAPYHDTWFQTLVSLGSTAHHCARFATALGRNDEAADLFAKALTIHCRELTPLWWTETVLEAAGSGLDVDGVDTDTVAAARQLRDQLVGSR